MTRVDLETKVLSENERIAGGLRSGLRSRGIYCVNLISSPGSGKTSLLEQTLARFDSGERVAVVTGDLQTDNDAVRLARYGFPVKQIQTGGACHLDARMIDKAIADWSLDDIDLLLIENVGNLVCPTSYDLGEHDKVVVLSVPEGEEKPLKYPGIFFRSSLMILNKIDLLPYVSFNIAKAKENARAVNPSIGIIEASCTTGAGLDEWMLWLRLKMATARSEHGAQTEMTAQA
jgi:hydrogenase nickel incorporation protein HypB